MTPFRDAWWWLLNEWEDSLLFKGLVVVVILLFGTVGATLAMRDVPGTDRRPSPQVRKLEPLPTHSLPLPGPTAAR
jgi:hypothetical protein